MVKCWDLEYNKVIRHYHGHLSGVYSLALHPALDVLMTGGRDSACRVWDMRTKTQVFCLSGHDNTVGSIVAQENNPQVITGSYDSTVKLWDLAAGKCAETLTYHKKGVRALALHPREFTLLSASADNIKKFSLPHGKFMHNMLSQQKSIVNSLSVNEDDVVVSGGDNGSLYFWDYKSGHNFQQAAPKVQPGSMESEAGIFASTFDRTGTRLITVEADKTIKMWKEDEDATPETHPNLEFHPPKDVRRY
jgi:pleiotropic regulator 1